METGGNVSELWPSSMITVIVGPRRRLTAFCDLDLVSNQISPSTTAYHIATRCGLPSASTVAIVAVLLRSMNSTISSSVMTMFARWLVPTWRYFQVATGVTVTGMPFSAPLPDGSSMNVGGDKMLV